MPPFSYVDKPSGGARNFVETDDELIATFRGTSGGIWEAIVDFFVSDYSDTDTALAEIVADKSTSITGIQEFRGFARVTKSPDPTLGATSQHVKVNLDNLKQNHDIINYSMALVEQHTGKSMHVYYLPGAFALQLKKEYLEAQPGNANKFLDNHGLGEPLINNWTPGLFQLPLPQNKTLQQAIAEFNAMNEVLFCEPLYCGFDDGQLLYPNESNFTDASSVFWGVKKINAVHPGGAGNNAWNHPKMGPGGSNGVPEVIIVVIDSGVKNSHQDLGCFSPTGGPNGSLLRRGTLEDWDFTNKLNKDPNDSSGHGTNVIGIIGALSPNIPPISGSCVGVAPGCKIMPLKVDIVSSLGGVYADRADAINFIGSTTTYYDYWGTQRGPGLAETNTSKRYIINMSWETNFDCAAVRTAIQTASNNNVLLVACAGNRQPQGIDVGQWVAGGSTGNVWPAAYPQVVAVAGTTQADAKTTSSNWGAKVVCAPGEAIFTTGYGSTSDYDNNLAGSSLSSAFVSAVAGLVYTANYKSHGNAFTIGASTVKAVITDVNNTTGSGNPAGKGRIKAYDCVDDSRV